MPLWRHPLLGYLFSVPRVGLSTGILLLESHFLPNLPSRGPVLSLAFVLLALIWGIGPAIFAVLLSTLTLNYFLLPPLNQFTLTTWDGLLQILPFMLAGLLIAIIAGQRESARQRAFSAEQEKQERVSLLEAVFDSMADTVIVYDSEGSIVRNAWPESPRATALSDLDGSPELDRQATDCLPLPNRRLSLGLPLFPRELSR